VTTDERLQFIELRKREIDLARAMVEKPDDFEIWKAWYSVAMQVDEICEKWDPAEQEVLNDLNRLLRVVHSGAFGIERLIGDSQKA
jgi:hypothetical protein